MGVSIFYDFVSGVSQEKCVAFIEIDTNGVYLIYDGVFCKTAAVFFTCGIVKNCEPRVIAPVTSLPSSPTSWY